MELRDSGIIFDEETHRYFDKDGKELQGITGMLSRQLFPDKYSGVPEQVLRRAANRGTNVHRTLELMDDLGIEPTIPEANYYGHLIKEFGMRYVASEYIVTDGEYFASPIDKVFRDGETEFSLADVKTTYALDREYVRWQLSIYAYFFEMQNPGAKVNKLLAIWLRPERGEMVEVERVPNVEVLKLLCAEIDGRQYTPDTPVLHNIEANLPKQYADMEDKLVEIAQQYKYWSEQKKKLTDGIKNAMLEAGVKKWIGDKTSFTLKTESTRKQFDVKRFATEHPELYSQYLTTKEVEPSIIFKEK